MSFSFVNVIKTKYANFFQGYCRSASLSERWKHIAKYLIRSLWYFPVLFVLLLLTLLLMAVLFLLKPVVVIRFGELAFHRIGEMTSRADLYLRRRVLREVPNDEIRVFFCKDPANGQMLKMIKRRLCVINNRTLYHIYKMVMPYTAKSRIWFGLIPYDEHAYREFNSTPCQFSFTEEERARGKQELQKMGIGPEERFICFLSRDKAYLDSKFGTAAREYFSYHDFRDSHVENFKKAAGYLAEAGMFVLRMGHFVEKPFDLPHHRVIDYAMKWRSDFMDVYLAGHCKFFLGDNTGMQNVVQAFGVPFAETNWLPMGDLMYVKQDIFILKKLWLKQEKRFLRFAEILSSDIQNWRRTELYEKAGIEPVENTPDEILDLAKEMNDRIDGVWEPSAEDEELQQRFRDLYPTGHRTHDFPSRIGAKFLRDNRVFLE